MTETPEPSPPQTVPTVDAPPTAPATAPLCYVVDDDASIRHFLSLVLHGAGIDTMEFPDGASMRAAIGLRVPDLVFLNISLEAADSIETVIALGRGNFHGHVQLTSMRGAAVLDHVKNIGIQHRLNMLPVLKKPFETDAIIQILRDLKLGTPTGAASHMDLDEAINNGWVEFWYQPKIDLRKKQLAGAEAYARARHPVHGIALPGAFMPDAKESSVITLSEMALHSALKAGLTFSKLGLNLRLTVNIPVNALERIRVEDIVRSYRPQASKWAGLIIDVPEEQIVTDLALAGELSTRLERCNVRLAIDDFGRGS
jgi:CheY-like chemotaxis protein